MAQRKPSRKKRTIHQSRLKNEPLIRSVSKRVTRRCIDRLKSRKEEKEWKDILIILIGFLIALVLIIVLYHYTSRRDNFGSF